MKKDDFLKSLKNITPEEINKIIKEKGKEPKPVKPIIFLKNI